VELTFAVTILLILAIIAGPALLTFAALSRWTRLSSPILMFLSIGVAGPLSIVGLGLLNDMEQGFCCREYPVTFWSEVPTYALYWGMAAAIALVQVLIARRLGCGERKPAEPDSSVFD
jgi:hypothetical protein